MNKCFLCDETRCLENAHIIPRYLYRNVLNANFPNVTIKLCPTHHSCFDRHRLTKEEKDLMRPLLAKYVPDVMDLHDGLKYRAIAIFGKADRISAIEGVLLRKKKIKDYLDKIVEVYA